MNSNGILFRQGLPAVNIKVYGLQYTNDIVEKFGCSETQASNALQYAFETEQENFYDYWCEGKAINKYFKGRKVKAHQVGRSGGHLVVEGLPEYDEKKWSEKLVNQWYKFEIDVDEDIKHRTSLENLTDLIEMNRWYEDKSDKGNWVKSDKGEFCMTDVKNAVNEFTQEKFGINVM
jgi:hypothetical protein